ncbi:hypothetical protein E3N88_24102 [Mikania micrantha]|uniref:Uncharacterized protein n=1 Tax=Mikania micrantha TaxID=192012 RepID=A0A5N6NF41_9ASTR|nr:hypothetical protein E3N88_24102 [Mikania micrantha]
MDSGDYSPPPSFLSGGTSSLDPQFPAYDQPTFTVHPLRSVPLPSNTFAWKMIFKPEFLTSGDQLSGAVLLRENYSATRFNGYEKPPPYFGVAPRNPSVPGVQNAPAPNLSALLHMNYSATGFHDDDGYEQAPSYSAVAPRNLQSPNLRGVVVKKYSATRLDGYEQAPPSFSARAVEMSARYACLAPSVDLNEQDERPPYRQALDL